MIQNTFNSGELTPLSHQRFDLASYGSSVARMKNFRPLLHGGAARDPGLEHLGFTLDNEKPYLLEFEFSTTQRFILEFTPGKLRFWTTGTTPAPLDLVLDTPYDLADLKRANFTRLNDLVYFADGTHPPQILTRTAEDVFTWQEMSFLHIPLDNQNENPEHTLTADITNAAGAPEWVTATAYAIGATVSYSGIIYICNQAHTSAIGNRPDNGATFAQNQVVSLATGRAPGRSITVQVPIWQEATDQPLAPAGTSLPLESSLDLFSSATNGEIFELAYRRTVEERRIREAIPASSAVTSPYIDCNGEFTIATTGNWSGTVIVEESEDLGKTWNDILTYESNADANFNESHTSSGAVILRLAIISTATVANSPTATLTVSDPFTRAAVRVTSFSDARNATVTALQPLRGRIASFWSRAAFSETNGYPAAVAFHRQRLVFGGTAAAPQKVWASALDQFDNFRRQELADEGTDPDRSFSFNIVSVNQNRIIWMASQKDIVLGTSAGEFVITGDQQSGLFAPGSYQIIPLSHHGCEPIRPIESENGLIFVQRGSRKVRHIGSLADIAFTPPDLEELSLFGEHLTRRGIISHTYQRSRDPIYWCCDETGGLHGYTHHPAQRVLAWHTHPLGTLAKATSLASTYSETEEDQLFISVEHTTPGGAVHTIERYSTGQREAQERASSPDYRYLHHYTASTETAGELVIPAIPHLAGKLLTVSLDGNAIARDLDPAEENTVSLPFDGTVVIGIPYASEIETLPPVLQSANGTANFLTTSQLGKLHVLLWRSATGRVRHSGNPKEIPLLTRNPRQPFNEPTDLATRPVQVDAVGGYGDRPSLTILADDPLPFTILAINYEVLPRQR